MKFRFVIEGGRHADHRKASESPDRRAALAEVEQAWRSMLDAPDERKRQERRTWVGGAVKIYAASFGLNAEQVLAGLTERLGSPGKVNTPTADPLAEFAEGFQPSPPDPTRPKRQQRTVVPGES